MAGRGQFQFKIKYKTLHIWNKLNLSSASFYFKTCTGRKHFILQYVSLLRCSFYTFLWGGIVCYKKLNVDKVMLNCFLCLESLKINKILDSFLWLFCYLGAIKLPHIDCKMSELRHRMTSSKDSHASHADQGKTNLKMDDHKDHG